MKLTRAANDNHTDRTRKVWEPRIGRDLTDDDARQIGENVTNFFSILAEWVRAEASTSANDDRNHTASISDEGGRNDR